MILLEISGSGLDDFYIIILTIMFGPPVLLFIVGFILILMEKSRGGKIFLILSGVYLLIAGGICATLLNN